MRTVVSGCKIYSFQHVIRKTEIVLLIRIRIDTLVNTNIKEHIIQMSYVTVMVDEKQTQSVRQCKYINGVTDEQSD